MLPKLNYVSFQFDLNPKEEIILPKYKGSAFRGGFGNALKKVVCTLRGKDCKECILREKCVYSYVFETIPPSNTKIMRKYQSAPHPFIIEPPLEEKNIYNKGETISFNLILLGKAIEYLPYFIYAFSELGTIGIGKGRGSFEVEKVKCERNVIYNLNDKKVKAPKIKSIPLKLINKEGKEEETLTLKFLTPVRIVSEEKLCDSISFSCIIKQLLRRVSLVSYFHCDIDPTEWDFKTIIEKSKEVKTEKENLIWHDFERYSNRQKRRMNLGGFLGEVTFKGNISQFMPLLKIGEILHVGKGTSFGLGKYKIID